MNVIFPGLFALLFFEFSLKGQADTDCQPSYASEIVHAEDRPCSFLSFGVTFTMGCLSMVGKIRTDVGVAADTYSQLVYCDRVWSLQLLQDAEKFIHSSSEIQENYPEKSPLRQFLMHVTRERPDFHQYPFQMQKLLVAYHVSNQSHEKVFCKPLDLFTYSEIVSEAVASIGNFTSILD